MLYFKSFILFLRNSFGTVINPYQTFRSISVENAEIRQGIFIHIIILFYFLSVSILKTGIRNPYLLTMKFNVLYFSFLVGFLIMLGLFFIFFRLLKTNIFPFITVFLLWSYSLLPTFFWFLFTSVLYLFFPPPRTLTYPGKIYSLSYLVLSLTLLFWKIILYYLTLRFALRLDLFKISLISLFIFPLIFLYSLLMFRLGIFKIPFI